MENSNIKQINVPISGATTTIIATEHIIVIGDRKLYVDYTPSIVDVIVYLEQTKIIFKISLY